MASRYEYDHPQLHLGSVITGEFLREYNKGNTGLNLYGVEVDGEWPVKGEDFHSWLETLTEYDEFVVCGDAIVSFLYIGSWDDSHKRENYKFPKERITILTTP